MNAHERRRGAWLGLAVGDALGAGVEFMTAQQIAAKHGHVTEMLGGGAFGWAPGETTDDTALALATAAADDGDDFVLERAADAMVAWLQTKPKDIGNLTRRALGMMASGISPREAGARCLESGGANAGNGSLMRCASTGLVRVPDDPRLVEESIALSAITHADSRCTASCVAFNAMLATLVHGGDLADGLQRAETLSRRIDAGVADLVEAVAVGAGPAFQNQPIGFVLVCLERALLAVRDATTIEQALVELVNEGGDADTNGAVAGALLGARFGVVGIPERWVCGLRVTRSMLSVFDSATAPTPVLDGRLGTAGGGDP